MLKTVTCGLAARQALYLWLEAPRDTNLIVSRKISEVFDCFRLLEAEDTIVTMRRAKVAARLGIDLEKADEEAEREIDKYIAASEKVPEKVVVSWRELLEVEGEETYEIDEVYLIFIEKGLAEHNWNKVVIQVSDPRRPGQVQVRELNVSLNIHHSRAIDRLGLALSAAKRVETKENEEQPE